MSATLDDVTPLLPNVSAEELADMITNFLNNGKTLKDMKGLTDENMEAIYGVAYQFYNSGNFEQAVKVFQFLCYFDHLEKKFWMGLGATRQMLKKYSEAIDAYSFAALLDVNDPRPPLQAADCHMALGNRDAAISGLTAAIEWSGDNPQYQTVKERATALLELLNQSAGG